MTSHISDTCGYIRNQTHSHTHTNSSVHAHTHKFARLSPSLSHLHPLLPLSSNFFANSCLMRAFPPPLSPLGIAPSVPPPPRVSSRRPLMPRSSFGEFARLRLCFSFGVPMCPRARIADHQSRAYRLPELQFSVHASAFLYQFGFLVMPW